MENVENKDNKQTLSKSDRDKIYRKQYYEKNKDLLIKKNMDRKEKLIELEIQFMEAKKSFIPEMKVFEDMYKNIDSQQKRLVAAKQDYKYMRYTFRDYTEAQPKYTEGTFKVWLMRLNSLLSRNKDKINDDLISKLKQMHPL